MPTIGPDGLVYLPFLLSLFLFIAISNLFEVIPFFQMPANARMGGPLVFALIVWVTWIYIGLKHHGAKLHQGHPVPARRAEGALPPRDADRVPLDLPHPALQPRRATLRQHARRPHPARDLQRAVHLALDREPAVRRAARRRSRCSSLLTGFEIGVAFLQAFVFTILTGVYIGGSLHPAH